MADTLGQREWQDAISRLRHRDVRFSGAPSSQRWEAVTDTTAWLPDIHRISAELRAHLATRLHDASGEKQAHLENRVADLTRRVNDLESALGLGASQAIQDPNLDWCQRNLALLAKHPGQFVAIDVPGDALIAWADSQAGLIDQLSHIAEAQRRNLYLVHTSLFI